MMRQGIMNSFGCTRGMLFLSKTNHPQNMILVYERKKKAHLFCFDSVLYIVSNLQQVSFLFPTKRCLSSETFNHYHKHITNV